MAAIKFLGASVNNVNVTLGYGTQPSELTATLAEDFKDGDRFLRPDVGTPVIFSGGNIDFAGLLQSWSKRLSTDGEIYDVRVSDPRELLAGTQIILKNYSSNIVGIKNLVNAYGYLQGTGDITDAGIPWRQVLAAINALYGNKVYYGQYTFDVDFGALPNIPDYYRIGGDQISLLDFISEICSVANYNFYVDMSTIKNINVHPVSRARQYDRGTIERFVNSVQGATSKEVGEELRLDTVNKFILGGKVRQFYYQASNIYADEVKGTKYTIPTYNLKSNWELMGAGTQAEVDRVYAAEIAKGNSPEAYRQSPMGGYPGRIELYKQTYKSDLTTNTIELDDSVSLSSDQNIWPYWGEDANGNLVMGEGYGDDHTFTINIEDISISYRGQKQYNYVTDVAEIRTAGESRDAWESFLGIQSAYKFKLNSVGKYIGYVYSINKATDKFTELMYANAPKESRHPSDPLLWGTGYRPTIRADIIATWNKHLRALRKTKNNKMTEEEVDEAAQAFFDNNVKGNDAQAYFVTYRHSGEYNIHYGKSVVLGLSGVINSATAARMLDQSMAPGHAAFMNMIADVEDGHKTEHEFALDRLFNRINDMYTNYYGKKFMVRIPFSISNISGDVTKVETTLKPTDSAPIDESVAGAAVQNGILPPYYDRFITDDGKVTSYVRADLAMKKVSRDEQGKKPLYEFARLDVSSLSADDYVFSPEGGSIFVRCQVEEELRFVHRGLLYGPRAIIELPSQLRYVEEDDGAGHGGVMAKFIQDVLANRTAAGDAYVESVTYEDIISRFGGEGLFIGRTSSLAYPIFAAIPLESQVQRYGPFYTMNKPGKVELTIDDNLTPWAYGSYNNMYGAAYAQCMGVLSQQYSSQSGSVTVPGLPTLGLGVSLLSNGPNITQIVVNNTDGGITTTYRMQSFTNSFGKLEQQFVKLIENQKRTINYIRARLASKDLSSQNRGRLTQNQAKMYARPHRLGPNTSHLVIGGDVTEGGYSVFSMPHYNFHQNVSGPNYEHRGFVSLDGLYVPVSFNPDHNGRFPKFKKIDGEDEANANTLNPYRHGSEGVSLIAVGDEPRECKSIVQEGLDIRGIALKAPLILSGWGYDTDDKPTPGETSMVLKEGERVATEQYGFIDGYKTDISKWKTGPLDVRWDDDRGVWAAGGGTNAKIVSIVGPSGDTTYDDIIDYLNNGSGLPASGWTLSNNWWVAKDENDNELYVKNIRANVVPRLDFIAFKIGGEYIIDNQLGFLV